MYGKSMYTKLFLNNHRHDFELFMQAQVLWLGKNNVAKWNMSSVNFSIMLFYV